MEEDRDTSDESDEVSAGEAALPERFKSKNDTIGWSSAPHDVRGREGHVNSKMSIFNMLEDTEEHLDDFLTINF